MGESEREEKYDWRKNAKSCSTDWCIKHARARRKGVFVRHGATQKRCSSEGCTNQAKNGAMSKKKKHGARARSEPIYAVLKGAQI
eukprot:scaffold33587_cov107-Skeletonema_dohrnii-CCMP3373.AAC.8